jgi:hypothetical protein
MSGEDVRMLITVSLPCFTVLVALLVNNHRLAEFQSNVNRRFDQVDQRFDDLIGLMDARFQAQDEKLYRVEQVINARLKHLESRL